MSIFLVQNGVLVAASEEQAETISFGWASEDDDWLCGSGPLAPAVRVAWPRSRRAHALGFVYRVEVMLQGQHMAHIYVRDFLEYLAAMQLLAVHIQAHSNELLTEQEFDRCRLQDS